jgi:hypothetical protein
MKRYYLSKIKQIDAPGMGLVWVHRLQEYDNIEYAGGEIATDPVTGIPTQKALFVLVASRHHGLFVNDAELAEMPMVPLDVKASAISAAAKNKAKNGAKALGFGNSETEALWSNADDFRAVCNAYGRLNNPVFNADDFDVSET